VRGQRLKWLDSLLSRLSSMSGTLIALLWLSSTGCNGPQQALPCPGAAANFAAAATTFKVLQYVYILSSFLDMVFHVTPIKQSR
jgi:hypothetical protein